MPVFDEATFSAPDPWTGEDDDPIQEYRYDAPYVAGRQIARIKWFKEHISGKGNKSYCVTWGLLPTPDAPDLGCRVDQYIPQQGERLRSFIASVAPEILKAPCEVPDAYFVGRQAYVDVEDETSEYLGETRTKPRVTACYPASASQKAAATQAPVSRVAPSTGVEMDIDESQIPF